MIEFRELAIAGVFEIVAGRLVDERGYFAEVFKADALRHHGIDVGWVQDNEAFSREAGILRGLHYQRPPAAQDKLIRVASGAILDVVVDIRAGSSTFGKWLGLVVSAAKWNQVYVPKGFAHGYRTIEPNTLVLYKVSAGYAPELEGAIRYDDPDIGIDWRLDGTTPVLSRKDALAPRLREQQVPFSM